MGGAGCCGKATPPACWKQPSSDDNKSFKGIIPLLPAFQAPGIQGLDRAGETKAVVDYCASFANDIGDNLARAVKAKFGWLNSPTAGKQPTAGYIATNTVEILFAGQALIKALNNVPNHDPATRTSSGDGGVGTVPDLAAILAVLSYQDRVTEAEEDIPQDPDADGAPVPLFIGLDASGKPAQVDESN